MGVCEVFIKNIKEKIRRIVKDAMIADEFISNYSNYCDIDAEGAKANYKKYHNDLKYVPQELIEKWCKEIHKASNQGKGFIFTDSFLTVDKNKISCFIGNDGCGHEFPSDYTLQNFCQYFENRGFKVIRIDYPHNTSCLKIIWASSEDK